MKEDYLDGQAVLKQILNKAISKNKLSHAYLVNINNNPNYDKIINDALKLILCPQHGADNCSICKRIDDGNYLEIKRIYPDGLNIKKEQLSDLKKEFNNKVLEGNYKIYIIYETDKLNLQAANSMLKFLEEPEDNIIAFLLTNNVNKMLKTIISRCQLITLNNNKRNHLSEKTLDNYLNLCQIDNNDQELVAIRENELLKVINFIKYLEKNQLFTLVKEKELWLDVFKERESSLRALELMIYFYNDCLRLLNNVSDSLFFISYMDTLKEVLNNNNADQIYHKITCLVDFSKWLRNNMNVNLMLDLLIIEFGGEGR